VNADDAILDGEIVKLDTDGRRSSTTSCAVAGRSPWSLSTF
jgi:hypothetical protein